MLDQDMDVCVKIFMRKDNTGPMKCLTTAAEPI